MLKQPKQFRPGAGHPQTLYLQTDLRGNILAVSPPLLLITGKSKEEIINKPFAGLILPGETLSLQAILETSGFQHELTIPLTVKGIRTCTTIDFSVARKEPGNQPPILEWRADFFDDERQAPLVSDNDAEMLFRQFADAAPGMMWISDEQDNTVYFNKSWLQFTGITVEDVAGDGWTKLIHPDDIPVAISSYRKYFRDRQPATLEYRIKTIDGQYRWVIDQSAPRFHADGRFLGFVGSVINIHDRKLAEITEESLRISEERYRSLVYALGEGIIVCDKTGIITACNDSAVKILDVGSAGLTGRSIYDPYTKYMTEDGKLVEPNDSPVARTLQTGETYKEVILSFAKRDSMLSWISINTEPIYYSTPIPGTGPDAVVVTIVDITDRNNHEQLLALEKKVLEMNALPAISLKVITDYFLEGLEKLFPGMLCSVLILDPQKKTIHPLSAPSLPVEYSTAITGRSIGPEDGSCGTAMYRKEKVISTDVGKDPLWDKYRNLANLFRIGACWSFPILDAHGEVLATIATYYHTPKIPGPKDLGILDRACDLLRIIIENKDAERKIRRNHERYLLVTKATNDAIWDWDMSTRDVYWGEGYFTLFGYKPGHITEGLDIWEECIHPDDRERVKNHLYKYLNNNNARLWEAEYRFKKSNGAYALVQDRGFFIFDHEGKMNRMVGSVQDITEKREMEKRLLETELNKQKLVAQAVVNAQEKERAEIGKDLHDNVNQILTTAKLYLELALVDEGEKDRLIQRCASGIMDAINEVRTISKSLVPASIGDLGLVESVQDLAESIRATKKLQVRFTHRGHIDELLDEKRKLTLFRIAQEQVNNVLKHSGAANLQIELNQDDSRICLSISDDGTGFDPATVRAHRGNGISNIISRADLFNGVVNIDTAPGKGCRLNVQVPIANF